MPIVSVNDAKLDVVQTGNGPDLVLLHSLLSDRTAFDRVAARLAQRRRVWLVNLPGYGQSTATVESVEDYADVIAALLAALGLDERAAVLGNGLGGFIATALAAHHGHAFERLIVAHALATFPESGKAPLRSLAERVGNDGMTAALDIAIRRMFAEHFTAAHPATVAERQRSLAQADPVYFQTACKALTRVDLTDDLRAIRNRALVMAGSLDAATPVGLVRELAAGITGARFVEFPDCGHCPQLEKPDLFADAVEAFLDE